MDYYKQIQWIDEYIKNVSPYIYVREYDSLLIKIPNQAFRLNKQGIDILKYLLEGGSVYSFVNRFGINEKEKISEDLNSFFCDLKAVLKGCYHCGDKRRSVEEIPFSLPFNSLPVLSEIAVTYKCNLACQFCYASCGCSKYDNEEDLSTDEIKEILYIIKSECEIPSVSFTGGEPLLRQDLPQLIKYAKSLGMWTNLITNGTLISEKVSEKLKCSGLDSVQVSIEAGKADLHDSIVQRKGSFEKTLEGINNLKKADIRIHTNTTISALNKDCIFDIVDFVESMDLNKFSMNMLMPEGSALENMDRMFISYSDIGDIIEKLNQYSQNKQIEFMWYSPTPICIFNPISCGLGNKGCAACDGLLSISPKGDILPCSSYPKSLGNILNMKGSFKRSWKSAEFKYFQQKKFAHKKCQECEDLAVCNGGCPLYWKQVGYSELLNQRKEVSV